MAFSLVASRPTGRCGKRASGFREIGLPFESDTAITRHLAAFLQAHGDGPDKSGAADPRAV